MPTTERSLTPILIALGAVFLGGVLLVCTGVGVFGVFGLSGRPATSPAKPAEVTSTNNEPVTKVHKQPDDKQRVPNPLTREVPPIELTDDLKALEIDIGSWKVVGRTGTQIVGILKPTKQPLDRVSRFIGRELRATGYDKNGLKLTGVDVSYPDLKPGESGEIKILLPYQYPFDKIGRIVLDKK
jgi:hypothetical protein